MANTKLPLIKWFLALYFVATNKDGISEMALAKYIGVSLKTAWALLHKIRSAMGKRESTYRLGGSVEMDEAFFGGNGHPQFLNMQVIPDAKGSTILAFAKDKVTGGSTIHSDAFRSYNALSKDYCCDMQKYESQSGDERLKQQNDIAFA